jgi:hypothetical protein
VALCHAYDKRGLLVICAGHDELPVIFKNDFQCAGCQQCDWPDLIFEELCATTQASSRNFFHKFVVPFFRKLRKNLI